MKDAQTFLEASRKANSALMGIHFAEIAREKAQLVKAEHLNKIDDGINLLEAILRTLEARDNQKTISSEALSILYVLSQGRMVSDPLALKKMLADSIIELKSFKEGKTKGLEDAEDLLEIIACSTSEEASKATSKIRIFMAEAR
jgi:predicted type IV restriction endonuclease